MSLELKHRCFAGNILWMSIASVTQCFVNWEGYLSLFAPLRSWLRVLAKAVMLKVHFGSRVIWFRWYQFAALYASSLSSWHVQSGVQEKLPNLRSFLSGWLDVSIVRIDICMACRPLMCVVCWLQYTVQHNNLRLSQNGHVLSVYQSVLRVSQHDGIEWGWEWDGGAGLSGIRDGWDNVDGDKQ